MSIQNSPVARGIDPKAISFDTITSHSWKSDDEWPGDKSDSTWSITPEAGQVIVLTGVLIEFTHGMKLPDAAAGKMTLKGHFADGVDPYLITEYGSVEDLYKRADTITYIPLTDPGGGPFRKPIISLKYEFSRHIYLWSSAGLTGDPENPLYEDALGIAKFGRLDVKIADDTPYKYHDGSALEIACSRYFATIYTDPGN